jgi:hypothetical protein
MELKIRVLTMYYLELDSPSSIYFRYAGLLPAPKNCCKSGKIGREQVRFGAEFGGECD